MSPQQDPTAGDIDNWLDSIEPDRADASERERIAVLIRGHPYDAEDETCACVSTSAASKSDIAHISIVEHSRHVADVILGFT